MAAFVAMNVLRSLVIPLIGEATAGIRSGSWLDDCFIPLVVFGAFISLAIMYRKGWRGLGRGEYDFFAQGGWVSFSRDLLKSIGSRSLQSGLLWSLGVAYVIALGSAFLLAQLNPPPLPTVEVNRIPQPESAQAVQEPDFQGKTLALLAHTEGHWYLIDEEEDNLLVVPDQPDKFIRLRLDEPESLEGATMSDGTIPAGRYLTTEFEPALSFGISSDGWQLIQRETPNELSIKGPEEGVLSFTSPLYVFDPSKPSELKEGPAPENAQEWASWFQSHPNLDTSEPVPVSVGGRSGVQIDVTESSPPENYPRDFCNEHPCVPLFPTFGSNGAFTYAEWKDRFVIVDVESETVVINVSAPADKFDEFAPAAQKVLDTVQWVGR
jgi:hypothetical protein